MPRLVSLFDGSGSICKPFRQAGWEVQSLDVDGRFGATIVQDILQWDYSKEPTPDVIFSGVPCTEYSQAKTRGIRNYALADSLVKKQWEIIKHFLEKNPELLYFIENPAFSQLWKRECAREFKNPHIILDYCCYGSPGFRKRTKIATNSNYIPRPLCNPKICVSCPDGKTHAKSAQKGPCRGKDFAVDRFSTDALHAYPESLCKDIFDHIQEGRWEVI
jgi:site-specific DNA-cytosine methylase